MNRVFQRLDVYIHGDRLHKARTIELVYKERQQRKIISSLELPDHSRKSFGNFRPNRNTVEPSPNAPLLKRLNTNPQQLDVGYFTREKLLKPSLDERKISKFPKISEELLQQQIKVRKIQPMKFHIQAESIQIPSVDQWLRGAE